MPVKPCHGQYSTTCPVHSQFCRELYSLGITCIWNTYVHVVGCFGVVKTSCFVLPPFLSLPASPLPPSPSPLPPQERTFTGSSNASMRTNLNDQLAKLQVKHQAEVDFLEDMRWVGVCVHMRACVCVSVFLNIMFVSISWCVCVYAHTHTCLVWSYAHHIRHSLVLVSYCGFCQRTFSAYFG